MHRHGFSLPELMVSVALLVLLGALAAQPVSRSRDSARARVAADHLASLLHATRLEALKRHVNAAIRFEGAGDAVCYAMYADGNGNGVRSADIDSGADTPIRTREWIGHQFPGVRFAVTDGLPAIDPSDPAPVEAVHVGRSHMVSFSPIGASTSGTLYLLGRGGHQLAVRVLGPTGRIRSFEFNTSSREWLPR